MTLHEIGWLLAVALLPQLAQAEEGPGGPTTGRSPLQKTAHRLVEKDGKAVVLVRVGFKAKVAMFGMEEDLTLDVAGTVVHESGMVAIPESALLGPRTLQKLVAGMGGMGGGGPGGPGGGGGGGPGGPGGGPGGGPPGAGGGGPTIDVELKESRVVKGAGSNSVYRAVLRDKELDLILLLPSKPFETRDYVRFRKKAASADLLERVLTLHRLAGSLNRRMAVTVTRIASRLGAKGPYVCRQADVADAVGCPAYRGDGSPLGIFLRVQRTVVDSETQIVPRFATPAVLVPAKRILEAVSTAWTAEKERLAKRKGVAAGSGG